MTDHRLFGQTDIDEVDGGELSLCCICGKTFLDRRSLHLHVAIDHEKEALTVSDTPPLAHSSTMNQIDEVDTCVPLPSLVVARSVAAAAVAAVDGADGESSDESCRPQDLRIRRSPIDCVSSGSVAAPPPILALPTANSRTTPPSSSLIATTSAAYLYQDVSREAYESQSDAINSGQSSTTEFPSNEHLPSQTSSPAGKSYHCELCNKYFTKSCNLNSHVKAVHKGVRAFQCSECQKSFSRNSDLQKHIDAVHKGLRPYECSTCQKRFSQKSSLKRHREAVHEGIKAFQCSHCSARFSYDVHLKRHIRAKHKTVSGTATSAAAPSEGVSSSSLPSSPVFQPTSLRQASI
ncbi:PR domain zinc finger protein 1 [Echinococcus granulosus]|uniref:Zinc finger C2H2 type n=1 Tax=Echinococcus granulosus TaxID=6210 RepID=A0A068WVP5_ECHGR|nr:PR domain zinc finger protein 1 [Echinococcus granulosus]CDS21700.1 zinc finger C2H2 type [Echinococcus granulosus]